MKMMLLSILMILRLCSIADIRKDTSPTYNQEIIGQWRIIKVEFPENYIENRPSENMAFFGADLWASSKGKTFHFKKDSSAITDVFTTGNEPITLFYEFNDSKELKMCLDKTLRDKCFELSLEINSSEMIWEIDEALKVKLKRDPD